jgi:DNA-binding transcriptional regulator YdaS (Cro superfamily)
MDLVEQLAAKQRETGASDAQFAARLGVTRAWWNQVRMGALGWAARSCPTSRANILSCRTT